MRWIDSHVHLEDDQYQLDRADVLERARQTGIHYMVNAGSTAAANSKVVEIVKQIPELFGAVGLHPHEFTGGTIANWAALQEQLTQEKIVAFGEMGLDYHIFPDFPLPDREAQQAAFSHQLELAQIYELPLIVHVREAFPDALRLIKQYGPFRNRGVIHCFSGSKQELAEILDMNFSIGIAGPVTYPKSEALREVVQTVPKEHFLLETDAPYLSPQTKRGKRNEPAFLQAIARQCAEVRKIPLEQLAEQAWTNTTELFKLGVADPGTIVYNIQGHLYINLTNRCSAHCVFCPRAASRQVQQHELTLQREPLAEEVLAAIGDVRQYSEIVFCGFGEPLLRLPTLLNVARVVKQKGGRVRVNTNGHADIIYPYDILPGCRGLVDEWSVSLNSTDAKQYTRLVRPAGGEAAHEKVIGFIDRAVRQGYSVTVSAVELPDVDSSKLAQMAKQLGARYRGRVPQQLGEPEIR